MEIRQAQARDIPALYRMNEAFNGVGVTTPQAMARALGSVPGECVLVALQAGTAVGFIVGQVHRSVCYSAPHGEVKELFVDEACRRRGVGRALLGALERFFAQNGITEVVLNTGADNAPARRLYEGCGYAGGQEMMYEKELKP